MKMNFNIIIEIMKINKISLKMTNFIKNNN